MFVTRLISGVILVAVALITIIAGGPVLMVTLAAVSLIGMGELYRAVGVRKQEKSACFPWRGYAGALLFDLLLYFQLSAYTMVGLMGALILLMAVYVFTYPRYRAEQVMAAFFGLIYVAVMLSYIYQTRNLPDGRLSGLADLSVLLGMRYLRLLRGNADREAQNVSQAEPQEVSGRSRGRRGRSGSAGALYAAAVGRFLETPGSQIPVYALICAVGALISW